MKAKAPKNDKAQQAAYRKLIAETMSMSIPELIERAINDKHHAVYTDALGRRGGEPGVRRFYQNGTETTRELPDELPVRRKAKKAKVAKLKPKKTGRSPFRKLLHEIYESEWDGEGTSQPKEAKKFLKYLIVMGFRDVDELSEGRLHFWQVIVNRYNKWLEGEYEDDEDWDGDDEDFSE